MFNASIGRLATADSPVWLDEESRKSIDDCAEPAQLLLDLVLSPEEQDDVRLHHNGVAIVFTYSLRQIYALYQGEDPSQEEADQGMSDDHEEQQIATQHLAELEKDEDATLE